MTTKTTTTMCKRRRDEQTNVNRQSRKWLKEMYREKEVIQKASKKEDFKERRRMSEEETYWKKMKTGKIYLKKK